MKPRPVRTHPKTAIAEPRAPRGESGFWKTMTEARMITTRLMVFPTACVTGATSLRAKKATSLYLQRMKATHTCATAADSDSRSLL